VAAFVSEIDGDVRSSGVEMVGDSNSGSSDRVTLLPARATDAATSDVTVASVVSSKKCSSSLGNTDATS